MISPSRLVCHTHGDWSVSFVKTHTMISSLPLTLLCALDPHVYLLLMLQILGEMSRQLSDHMSKDIAPTSSPLLFSSFLLSTWLSELS